MSKPHNNECSHFEWCPIYFVTNCMENSCLLHEQSLQWNEITLKRLQNNTQLWKNHIWSSLLLNICCKFLAFQGGVWDASLEMPFHGLKRMRFLLTPLLNANYPMLNEQKFHGMLLCGSGSSISPFESKKCKQSLIFTH